MGANIFPTSIPAAVPETTVTPASQVTFGTSWGFDFTLGEFVTSATGKGMVTAGAQAWIDWCQKALITTRYTFPIYGRYYGQEFADLIRKNLSRAGNESEIKRLVTEALMVDPRTASVDNFTFSWDGDTVYFTCRITSVWDETAIIANKVVT
jgi:hypothetical protein